MYERIPAIMEKYDTNFRITPERPTRKTKGVTSSFKKIKAEVFHWDETDSMDIFFIPPRNTTRATTRVVKRFEWGGSVSRSIYGRYRISLPSEDIKTGKPISLAALQSFAAEAQRWINEDKKTFNPLPTPEKKGSKK